MASLIDTYAMPPVALLKRYDGACRYISHNTAKTLKLSQVKTIHGLKKVIVPNFEDLNSNAKGGAEQGRKDATFVVSELLALRCPKGVACYFSVDFQVLISAETDEVVAYFRAIEPIMRAAGYLIGAYGDYDVIKKLLSLHIIDFAWQTAAWSDGERYRGAVLYQDVFTRAYDVDELQATYYGGWTYKGAQTPPKPSPASVGPTTEEPMATIVYVDEKDCKKRGKQWPGYFRTTGMEKPVHIKTPAFLAALRLICPQRTVTYAEYYELETAS